MSRNEHQPQCYGNVRKRTKRSLYKTRVFLFLIFSQYQQELRHSTPRFRFYGGVADILEKQETEDKARDGKDLEFIPVLDN
jgi:hypothetical protein